MATEKELLLAFVSKTLNIDKEAAVASLYNEDGSLKDDALTWATTENAKHIANIKTEAEKESKGAFDNGYKKAQKEVREKDEKSIKDKFGLKSERLLEMVDELATKTVDVNNLPEDVVKKSPYFIAAEKKLLEQVEQTKTEYEGKIKAKDEEYGQKETFNVVRSTAQKILLEQVKPKLSENDVVRSTQLNNYLNEFGQYQFSVVKTTDGKEEIIVSDKNGKRLQNDHGHYIPIDTLAKQIAERHFEIPVGENRSTGTGDNKSNNNNGAGSKFSFSKPKNEEEYMQQLVSIQDNKTYSPEERRDAAAALKEIHTGTGG